MRRRASGITSVQASDEATVKRSELSQDASLADEGDLKRVPKRVALGVGALVVAAGTIIPLRLLAYHSNTQSRHRSGARCGSGRRHGSFLVKRPRSLK